MRHEKTDGCFLTRSELKCDIAADLLVKHVHSSTDLSTCQSSCFWRSVCDAKYEAMFIFLLKLRNDTIWETIRGAFSVSRVHLNKNFIERDKFYHKYRNFFTNTIVLRKWSQQDFLVDTVIESRAKMAHSFPYGHKFNVGFWHPVAITVKPVSETTCHLKPQFGCTNSFFLIYLTWAQRPPCNVRPKATFLWPQVHILPVNKDHFDEQIENVGTGTLSNIE